MTSLIEGLESQSGRKGTDTDHGDDLLFTTSGVPGYCNAERGGDRGTGVTDIKAVMRALCTLGKAAEAVQLPQGMEPFIASGQKLVCVRLVSDIPDDLVGWRVVNPV